VLEPAGYSGGRAGRVNMPEENNAEHHSAEMAHGSMINKPMVGWFKFY